MSEKAKKEAYWSEQNQEWEMSGLGQQKFCEQRGLSYRKFIYWRGLLRAGRKSDSKPKLLQVSTSTNELKQQPISQPDLGLEVTLPTGIKLCIKTELDIRKASALIHLLGGAR
tara:strand:+ start:242 stop:580 length:339 start_codon:yes stop_codon:yes gene_type:complete